MRFDAQSRRCKSCSKRATSGGSAKFHAEEKLLSIFWQKGMTNMRVLLAAWAKIRKHCEAVEWSGIAFGDE